MPPLQSYFDDFIKKVKLQPDLREQLQEAHQDLTERLDADKQLGLILVGTFLQGSYKRSTIIEPDTDAAADVDVVVVTTLDERQFPKAELAMRLFEPFLQQNYPNLWEPQARSYGIAHGRIKMDMVITSAPSEAVQMIVRSRALQSRLALEDDREFRVSRTWRPEAERALVGNWRARMMAEAAEEGGWRDEPLRIPDRDRQCWEPTHPIRQIDWTAEKNANCDGKYIDVVRALKHWRRRNPEPKYPKGYPLEHLVGAACPSCITTTAEGVVRTLETLASDWAEDVAAQRQPYLKDHGVDQNVLGRVSPEDFARFHRLVVDAAPVARQAYETDDKNTGVQLWQKLFGGLFPDPPDWGRGGRAGSGPDDSGSPAGGFTPRTEPGLIGGGRFG
jgi:hypothetical protein